MYQEPELKHNAIDCYPFIPLDIYFCNGEIDTIFKKNIEKIYENKDRPNSSYQLSDLTISIIDKYLKKNTKDNGITHPKYTIKRVNGQIKLLITDDTTDADAGTGADAGTDAELSQDHTENVPGVEVKRSLSLRSLEPVSGSSGAETTESGQEDITSMTKSTSIDENELYKYIYEIIDLINKLNEKIEMKNKIDKELDELPDDTTLKANKLLDDLQALVEQAEDPKVGDKERIIQEAQEKLNQLNSVPNHKKIKSLKYKLNKVINSIDEIKFKIIKLKNKAELTPEYFDSMLGKYDGLAKDNLLMMK